MRFEIHSPSNFRLVLAYALACVILMTPVHAKYQPAKVTSPTASAQKNQKTSDNRKKGKDSDGDGIPDSQDHCPNTPSGSMVDDNGCKIADSDLDGIPDSVDLCIGAAGVSQGIVDSYGCPIDQDEDGIPDVADSCPNGILGGLIDASGCAIDSDGDGVPDGLDLCPETLPGVEVDSRGCVNLAVFNQPLMLYPDYLPGSFEIDPKTKERLRRLSGLLLMAPSVRVDIYSYTDNVGQDEANRQLAERRARRAFDFLVAQGIDAKRMRTFGRGESNFLSSNETADGRAKNRRLEFLFLK